MAHIRKNLPNLLKDTSCSSSFLASLYADGIVSDEEIQILDAISTQRAQAKRLYEIIQTRKDSFNLLKQALKDTAQSGALAILNQCNQQNVPIPFKNCGSISYIREIMLGRGSYSTRVFKGKFENRDVAVKRLNRDDVEMVDVQKEVNFLTLLDSHKNVVRYFKTEVSDEYIFIALELCDVNLFNWVIQKQKPVEINEMEVIKQTTEGVAHLHFNRVIHRDLKPTNILLVSRSVGDTQVKISDFGLSKRIPVGVSKLSGHTVGVGTGEWMAPEVAGGLNFQNNVAVGMSFASDVFSLGCIYYFVLSSGLHPFGEASRCQGNILDGKYQLNVENITAWDGNASGLIKLTSKMIAHVRGERPTVFDVMGLLPDVTTTSQKSIILPFSQQNVSQEESAKQAIGHTIDEQPDIVVIASGMKGKLNLANVDELGNWKTAHLSNYPEAVAFASDMEIAKWEDTKEKKLHQAIRSGDMQTIQELIKLGADVDCKDSKIKAPLMIAAAGAVDGNMTYDISKYLMEHGADVFNADSDGHTFLHKLLLNTRTVEPGFGAFAQYLVDKKLSSLFDTRDITSGATPLMLAVKNVKLDMSTISLLQKHRADLPLTDKIESSYLSYTAEGNKNKKLLADLHRNEAKKRINLQLTQAIQDMDSHTVEALVKLGADVNEQNDELKTPLHLAAQLANKTIAINIIQCLINSGANVDAKDKYNKTFLHLLVLRNGIINSGQFDNMAAFLISKDLSRLFNVPDNTLNTPFQLAVHGMDIERATLALLKKNGVDFNAVDKSGCSVLYWAIMSNQPLKFITDLVDLGADPKQLTSKECTILHIAVWKGNLSLLKFFLGKGLDVNGQDKDGKTPLHYALSGEMEIIEKVLWTVMRLLENGAECDIVDKNGESAKDYFIKNRESFIEPHEICACLFIS